jgi:NADH dehydrogenase
MQSGLDYVIFRPSIVYGVEDDFINKIAGMLKFSPVAPVIGDGKYQFQPVYVEELAAITAFAADKDFVSEKIYEVAGPEKLTYLELLNIIMRVLNKRRPVVHVPFSLAHAAAAVLEKIIKPAPLTTDQLAMMRAGNTCDHTVVEREFGVTFTPVEQQLRKYLGKT